MVENNTEIEASSEREASECSALLGRCGTCLHWGNSRNYADDKDERLKSCDCPKFEYGYHSEMEDISNDGAAIEDDEGWGMLTGSEFGCIHWVSKEP